MRFPELLSRVEQLRSDFAWLCDFLLTAELAPEGDEARDILRELIREYASPEATSAVPREREAGQAEGGVGR